MRDLIARGGIWHFNRWTPDRYRNVEPRPIVRQSTGVKVAHDPNGIAAGRIAARMADELEAYWRGLEAGGAARSAVELKAAMRRARSLGFDYKPAAELAAAASSPAGIEDIVRRVIAAMSGPEDPGKIAALLGGVAPANASGIMLSGLFDKYQGQVAVEIRKKSPGQLRVWEHKHKRAARNLVELVGDKDIAHLSKADAQEFRAWWADRITQEGVQRDTANKDFQYLSIMLSTVAQHEHLELEAYFERIRFKGSDEGQGKPYSESFIQNRLLADGALDELNDEARAIVYVMTETGLRPSEIVALGRNTIRLGDAIPHVVVAAEGREVKTRNALRELPLVGVALAAMREHPGGFPNYHDNAAGLSAVVNKFLRSRGLTEPGCTLYSLRHSFMDRMRAKTPSDEFMRFMMGHALKGERYGNGYTLKAKAEFLRSIAFKAPASV